MKIFSFITVALLGVSSVCAAPAADEATIATGPREFQLIQLVSGLVQEAVDKLGGQAAITSEIFSIVGQTATTDGRRALEDVDSVDLLGTNATSAITGVVENWLNDLPDEIVGGVSGTGDGRKLSLDPGTVLLVVRSVSCIILSIFIDNILYSQVEDLEDYSDNLVCLKAGECEVDGVTVEKLKFVSEHAKGNEFLYNSKGPCQLQGVFRLFYQGYCSSIVSFAETVEAFPLSTGELRESLFPLFPNLNPALTYDGFTYNVRVSGASNWAFSSDNGCYDFVKSVDLIYGLKPFPDPSSSNEYSIDNPNGFVIVPSIKLGNLRVSIDSECTVDTFGWSLLRFEMVLIENCADISSNVFNKFGISDAFVACEAGATIWERRTYILQHMSAAPASIYYVIQIVDGFGDEVQPAYDDWVDYEGASYAPQPYVNAFRSLEKSEKSKSEKSEGKCEKKGKSLKKLAKKSVKNQAR